MTRLGFHRGDLLRKCVLSVEFKDVFGHLATDDCVVFACSAGGTPFSTQD